MFVRDTTYPLSYISNNVGGYHFFNRYVWARNGRSSIFSLDAVRLATASGVLQCNSTRNAKLRLLDAFRSPARRA